MKTLGTYAMFTDHDYYGGPIEVSSVTVLVDEAAQPFAKELRALAIARLHSMAKRMPYRYWRERDKRDGKKYLQGRPITRPVEG